MYFQKIKQILLDINHIKKICVTKTMSGLKTDQKFFRLLCQRVVNPITKKEITITIAISTVAIIM